jgi:hypothetical protein
MRTLLDGEVHVHYWQIYVESGDIGVPDLEGAFVGQANGICGAAVPYGLFLITGSHTGAIGFRVELHEVPPWLDETWEDVVEVSFRPATTEVALLDWDGQSYPLDLEPTDYRVRYCASGMDEAREHDTRREDEPMLDRYLLQFWPAPPAPDRVLKQASETARSEHRHVRGLPPEFEGAAPGSEGAAPASRDAAPESEDAASGSEGGAPASPDAAPGSEDAAPGPEDIALRPDNEPGPQDAPPGSENASPETEEGTETGLRARLQAERARLQAERAREERLVRFEERRWGGRQPTERLRNVGGNARGLAWLDRDLVDAIADADPALQRTIAGWAARRAYTLAGIATLGWVAPALAAAELGQALPPPFDDRARVWQLLHSDRRVPRTTVAPLRGGPGSKSQQHMAVPALFAAVHDDPLQAALDSLYAAVAVGGSHRLLLDEVRRTFGVTSTPR